MRSQSLALFALAALPSSLATITKTTTLTETQTTTITHIYASSTAVETSLYPTKKAIVLTAPSYNTSTIVYGTASISAAYPTVNGTNPSAPFASGAAPTGSVPISPPTPSGIGNAGCSNMVSGSLVLGFAVLVAAGVY